MLSTSSEKPPDFTDSLSPLAMAIARGIESPVELGRQRDFSMTLSINLSPELVSRLKIAAGERGIDEAEYARQLIEMNLTPTAPSRDHATLELLAKWKAEGDSISPAEVKLAEKEWEEFRKSMNENSLSGRPIYP